MPFWRMRFTVLGIFSGSLLPQSAALLMTMRSVPHVFKISTIRGSSILVSG